MKKISFEEWKNHYYDVPFIKENYDLLMEERNKVKKRSKAIYKEFN